MTASPPSLGRAERYLLFSVLPVGAGVGGLGLATSFDSVARAAAEWGFTYPWMLPVGIDVAIPVFTAAHLLLIRLGMRLWWVRWVPWALTLVTCGLNIAAGESIAAKVAHGTMPLLWVALSEVVAHVYAVRIGEATGARMERIRRSRWFLAPRSTFGLWRRMTLWEVTSYREALELEKQRLLTCAELREEYGPKWRKKAPLRDRILLQLGELAPADAFPDEDDGDAKGGDKRQDEAPKRAKRPRRRPARRKPRPSFEEHLVNARKTTVDWPDSDLTAERIRTAVGCGQERSRELREALKADRRRQHDSEEQPKELAPALAG